MFPTVVQLETYQTALSGSLLQFLPELLICLGIVGILLLRMLPRGERQHAGAWATAVLVAAGFALGWQVAASAYAGSFFHGMLVADAFAGVLRLWILAGTLLVVLLTLTTAVPERADSAELYVLLLGGTLGMMLMVSAQHVLMLFMAVEMASVPSYVLAGYLRQQRSSSEAALKYVVYGAAASGVMLYGISLLAGLFGTGYLPNLMEGIARRGLDLPVLAGLTLLFVGLGFKLAVVPFHFWCPDVFEGAATEVGVSLSTVSKAAAAGLLLRLVMQLHLYPGESGPVRQAIGLPLGLLAAATMTLGNLAAFAQNHLQRLLAYSTIAHAGYILLGIAVATPAAAAAVLYYLAAYILMNMGAFAAVAVLRDRCGTLALDELHGVVRYYPVTVVALAVCLCSLLGLPPLAGFAAKFQLFLAVYAAGRAGTAAAATEAVWLALLAIALINTVVSGYYYLRVLRRMVLDEPAADRVTAAAIPSPSAVAAGGLLVGIAAALVVFGVYWYPWETLAEQAVQAVVMR